MFTTRRRLRTAALASLLTASLTLSACGGDDADKKAESPDTPQQTLDDGTVISSTWPLTGVEASGEEDVALDHPVLVVKVENNAEAVPQVGLSKADLVVEEMVEGNTTRLAAFFYSQIPDVVGPVRSMRASDLSIVPKGGRIVTSGAAPVTIKRIKDAGYTFYNESAKGMYRESGRSAPHNLFVHLDEVAENAKVDAARPADYLQWGTEADLPKGKPADSLVADFGGQRTEWTYDGSGYTSPNSYAGKGDQFPAETILVFRVEVGDAGYKDPSGSYVPETKFTGKGDALLFHGGKVVPATWAKDGLDGEITLQAGGKELSVPAGKVWIELVPAKGGDVTYSKK